MIDFERLHQQKDELREKFLSAKPFPHIAIDNFLKEGYAEKLYEEAPKPDLKKKIKDPFFSKNRYQYPDYKDFSESRRTLSSASCQAQGRTSPDEDDAPGYLSPG